MDERFDDITRKLSFDDIERLASVGEILVRLQNSVAEAFHINENDMEAIMSGRVVVDRVIFQEVKPIDSAPVVSSERNNLFPPPRLLKRASLVAMATLLILCLAIPDFSDGVRTSFLGIFPRDVEVSVEPVSYEKSDDLRGYLLPAYMPNGFKPVSHTLTQRNVLHVSYQNDEGAPIEYDYSPAGNANEHTVYRRLPYNGGNDVAYLGSTEEGGLVMCLQQNGAYIQMAFSATVTEGDLVAIAEGLTPVGG